jgi:hypothetical protein
MPLHDATHRSRLFPRPAVLAPRIRHVVAHRGIWPRIDAASPPLFAALSEHFSSLSELSSPLSEILSALP